MDYFNKAAIRTMFVFAHGIDFFLLLHVMQGTILKSIFKSWLIFTLKCSKNLSQISAPTLLTLLLPWGRSPAESLLTWTAACRQDTNKLRLPCSPGAAQGAQRQLGLKGFLRAWMLMELIHTSICFRETCGLLLQKSSRDPGVRSTAWSGEQAAAQWNLQRLHHKVSSYEPLRTSSGEVTAWI